MFCLDESLNFLSSFPILKAGTCLSGLLSIYNPLYIGDAARCLDEV